MNAVTNKMNAVTNKMNAVTNNKLYFLCENQELIPTIVEIVKRLLEKMDLECIIFTNEQPIKPSITLIKTAYVIKCKHLRFNSRVCYTKEDRDLLKIAMATLGRANTLVADTSFLRDNGPLIGSINIKKRLTEEYPKLHLIFIGSQSSDYEQPLISGARYAAEIGHFFLNEPIYISSEPIPKSIHTLLSRKYNKSKYPLLYADHFKLTR